MAAPKSAENHWDEFEEKSQENETWLDFPNRGKAIEEQTLASKEINKSKRAELCESQSGIWEVELTI